MKTQSATTAKIEARETTARRVPKGRLAIAALGTSKRSLPHVGCLVLAVGGVIFLAALAHEDALPEPSEYRHTRLGFGHVALRPTPCFVSDQPAP